VSLTMLGSSKTTLTANTVWDGLNTFNTDTYIQMRDLNLTMADSRINPSIRLRMPYFATVPYQVIGQYGNLPPMHLMVNWENWATEAGKVRVHFMAGDDFSMAGLIPPPTRAFAFTGSGPAKRKVLEAPRIPRPYDLPAVEAPPSYSGGHYAAPPTSSSSSTHAAYNAAPKSTKKQ